MRKTIYATLAIGSVMAITVPAAAQADEVCFGENSVMSAPPAISKATVTSPEPGKLKVTGAVTEGPGSQEHYTSAVVQIHEGSSYYFAQEVETGLKIEVAFNVAPGYWTVTGFARRDESFPTYGLAWHCHSPIQALGGASVAPIKVAPLRREHA